MTESVQYSDQIQRLVLGLQVLDALSRRQVSYPLRADVEHGVPHTAPKPRQKFSFSQQQGKLPVAMTRHASGRYSLVYQAGLTQHIDIRLYDHHRQYVPRRLRLNLLTLQAVLDIEVNEEADYLRGRNRQPVMFPGAAYDLSSKASGLRGRVLRGGEPMPWAWVEAYSAIDNQLVGRARGDERGEFLLLLNSVIAGAGELASAYGVRVVVFGPQVTPAPAHADIPRQDALWNLPIEEVPAAGNVDGVSPGETLPPGYVEGASAVVPCQTGRVLTGADTADFDFTVA